jgi:hypothetical protein
LPLAPLLAPMPGCCAWLMSIDGWDGCWDGTVVEAPPLTPPGGTATEPPPVMPVEPLPLVVGEEAPAPAPVDAPPLDGWAWANDASETAPAMARSIAFVMADLRG